MASFPDLRPHRRSAKAERSVASKNRARLLLAVSAALLFTASLAVSEFATLRGAKAHDASAFLTRELGPPLDSASLVRKPAQDVRIRVRHGGFDYRTPAGSISLVSHDAGKGSWRRFEHGTLRDVSIGQEAVTVHGTSVEQSLRVVARHGRRTWRWQLDSTLEPRLANGYVSFFAGRRLVDLEIQPVKILDDEGRDVTPKGAHWSLRRQSGQAWLELALNDAKLPLPYTIDPAVVRTAGTVATGNPTFNVTIPAGVQTGDLLVIVLAQATNAIPATPTGWTLVPNSGGTVAGGGTKLGYATFYRKGLAADSNTAASMVTTAAGVAEVFVYRGVDTTLTTSCPSATCMIRQAAAAPTGATGTTLTFPTITTAMASEEVVGTGTTLLDVAWPAASTTGSYARQSPQHANNGATISLALYDQNVTTSGTAVAGTITITSAKNLGFTFGLTNDTNPPTSGAEAIGGISPAGVAYQPSAGGTIYYNGNGSGQFTISDPISDPESGPGSVTYPAVATSGWTHALETVSTGANYTSSAYQWASGTHTAPSAAERTLNEKDNGDNPTTSNVVAIVDDSTAPAGGALTVNGTAASGGGSSSYDTDGSFTIGTRTDYSETQSATASGLASSTLVRTSASYSSPDVCGSFGSPSTITGNPSESGLATGCYEYTLTGTDNVGNTVSISTTVKVDTSDPSAPTFSFASVSGGAYYAGSGTRVYFKPDAVSGTFDITASSNDSDTGIGSYTFPAGSALGTNWSGSGSGATRTYSYTGTATTNGSQNVTATNNAGRTSSSSSFDVTLDSTAPTGGALTVNGTAASGGGSSSYDTDGSFTIGTRTDYSETQSATASGLASSTLVRTSASYSSPDTCGSFGSPSTITGNPSESGLATGCYKYTLTGTDNVGNTVSISTTVKVDTSDPAAPSLSFASVSGGAYHPGSGTRVYFKPDAATGTFDITASSSDSDTGIASYGFPTGSALGTNWSGSGSGATRTYSYTATATTTGSQNASATNNAGRSASSSFDVTLDSTAPAGGALTVNGTVATGGGSSSYDTDGSFTIGTRTDYSETQSGTASGLASATLVRTSASYSSPDVCGSFGSPSTITGNPSESGLATGCYKYTLSGTDNVGNIVSISTTVKVDTSDPSAPTLSFASVSGGAYYAGSGTRVYFKPDAATGTFDITASSSDSDAGIASYGFPAGSALGTNWSGSGSGATRTYSYTATATTNGSQNASATNNAGRSASSSFDVTADSTAPAGGALTVNGTVASGGGSSSYDTDGSFTIGTRTDYSETQSATASGLASSTLVRTSASYSSPDVCGSFGSPSTITGNPSESGLATGCYKYTLTGTDNVGNTVSISTTVKVDTSAPSNPSLSISNATGGTHYPGAGTQIFFKPDAANGGFDLTASSTDSDTGIAGYTFPTAGAMGTNWAASGSGTTRTYSFTPTAAEPGSKSVSAANNAGGSASSNFTVTADSAAPTTTAQCNGAACLNGTYYTSAPVSVALSSNDGSGSGVEKIRYTTDGTDPTPVNGSDYSGAISINSTTTVKFRAYDNLGNEEAVGSQDVLLDGTPPNLSLTLTENPSSGAQHVSGSTLFYRPGTGGGTFRVTATADDPHTGLTSVDFPAVTNVTGGSSQTSSPYVEDYTWSASTTDAASHDVVATNGAGATTNVPFTLTQDSTAPTGQSITLTGANAPYYGSASVSFTLGDGNDGSGSGLDTSSRTVTRESASLTGDSCGSFTADAGTYSSPDTSVSNGNCYRYSFTITDNVGNTSSSVTATAKVDTQAPNVSLSAPTELTGAGNQYYDGATKTQFFRPAGSGSFGLNATASDSETAVASVSFPDVSGLSGWSGSTGGADTTSPYSSPADYAWSSGAVEPGARNISGSDKAANSSSDTIALTADSTAPTGQSLTLTGANAPYYGAASVTFSFADGNDGAGSGLDLSSRSITRETGDLVAGACSNFTADAGSFSSPDTAVSGGHCYRYTFTIADRVGNVSSTVTATAKVDTDAPSVSVTAPTELTGAGNQYYDAGSQTQFFRPAGSGSFSLHATASDGQSTVAQVAFPNVGSVSGWTGSIGGADGSSPYTSPNDYSWGPGATAPGASSITATNAAAIDGVATITLAADSTAPTGQSLTLTGANVPYYNTASVTFSLVDGSDPAGGAGLDTSTRSVSRETGDLVAGNCSNFSPDAGSFSSPDTAVSTGHCYRYSFTIADNVGNVSNAVSSIAKVDTDAPNTTIDSSPSDPSGSTTPSFSFSSSESGSSFECRVDGGSWTSCSSPDTISPALSGGGHTFDVRATDAAANTDATPASYTWTVDLTAPNTTIDSSPADPSNNTTPDFSFSSSESGSSFECRVDGGSWSSCSSPDVVSPALSGGSHTFDVRATDTSGNTDATPASYTWTVDLSAPNTTIDSSPADPSNDTIPSFTFSSSEGGSSLECRVDGGSWNSCTSPESISPALTAGSHTFDVRATDAAGNTDATPASYTWTVDLTAPNTTIDSSPSDPSNNTTPDFSFSSSESGSSFECRIDSGSWNSCTSPESISPALTAGSHTFQVRATDGAGNTDATPASHTWTIDLTAPNTIIDVNPSDPSNNTTPSFTFSSNEGGSTFECRVDGGSWNFCTSPHSLAALAAGSHTFEVRATDAAGNTDATPASYTWTVDLTAANTTIDSNPADPSNNTTPSFTFSSSEAGSSFECRVDGGSWTSCTSPESISPALTAGSHTFQVRATDGAGNTDATPASHTWTIDLTAPNTTIDSNPSDPSGNTTPSFSFSSSESGSSFECRVDSGSWTSCTSPESISPALTAGSHTFDVRAIDAAGNTDATPASYTWTVDLTAPNTTIDSNPADPSNNTTPSFTFSSSEAGSSFECRVDGGSWTSCTSPESISPALSGGSHTFDVRATDTSGNTDGTPASYTWTVDLTAPNTTIDSNPADPSNNTTPSFTFSSNEGGSSFECRVDGGSWTSCSSPDVVSPALSGGSHTFDVRATDAAGNTDVTPASYTWTVDLSAPNTTIDSSLSDPSNNTTPDFSFSSSEMGSSFECRVDGGSWTSCSSPDTISPALSAGSHIFQVRATDGAGNTDATPASHTWTVDLTAPNTTIDSSPSSPSGNTTPTFAFSSSESGSSFECRIDSGSWNSCTSPDTISPALGEGSHTFDVRAVDPAGNADGTPASHTWLIDTGAPTVTITDPTTYLNGSDPNNYTVTASTPDGDVTNVDFFECSNASTSCSTGSWIQFGTDNSAPFSATWSTPAFDGPKAIRALAVDAATNTGQHVRTITIDRTAPTGVTVTYPNGYVTGSYSITTDDGSDPDVNASTGSLERQTGDLANNACSSYGSWTAASSPDTLASGKCARYRYSVWDNVGNVALATSSNEVKSDTAAPTSTLTDPGADLRQTITLSASASDTDGSDVNSVAFQRRPAGGGSWTTIAADGASPYSISFDTTSVADGLYDFRSVATDTAGNSEASPVVVANRRVDNTAPSATMLSPGNPVGGPVTLTSNTSDTGGSGIATVAYELAPNGGSFNSQSTSWDTTLVSDGLYDLRVVATDVAGNSTSSAAVTTRVDNTAPALTFSSPATGTVVSGTVNLVGSASDASPASPVVTFAYKLASDPPSAYTATGASWNTATLPAGDEIYDLRARATDDASNTATVENTSIRVDNEPPTISITAPAAAINGSLPSPTTFAANANDPAGSGVTQVQFFECSDQSNDCATGVWNPLGTVAAPGPYSVSWSIPAADGNHALAAVATDNAGHPATAIRNVNVDRTAPSTTILTKPSDPSNLAVPSFTFDSSEPGSTFECSIDGGSFASCTSPHNVAGLTDNDHTFDVRATDAAGNTDATPATWTWHRDTSDPTGTLNNPGANIRQTATLTSTEADPPANGYASGLQSVTYEYSANGTTWASIGTLNSAPFDTILWNTTGVTDGVYQLHVVVRDVAGNTTTSAAVPNVRIDNTVPTTSQNDPGQYLRATKTLTGSAADSGSGIDHVDFQRAPTGGGSWTTIATDSTPLDGFQVSFDTTTVSDGHYDFQTVAYDVAGNQAAATPVSDRLVDNTVPTATINSPGPYLRGAVNLTSSTGDPGGSNASGVVTVAYEYSTNGGGSWQSTGANFNSAAVPDGYVDLHVVATDAAGNTTTSAAVTSLADNTKPATTDNAPSGWQSSPVTVTLTANDSGSGVNVTEYSVDGNPAYTVGTSVVIPAPADGSNDGAHTIAYFSADNAGNIETIKSATVLIDATPPACPSCSAADYLRGTVTLSADPDSSGSGIRSVAFEFTDAGGSTWTTINTDITGPGPYMADWDTTPVADGHYDLRIQITDNADNVTTTSLPDKVVDNTAPDVAVVGAPTEGQLVSGTIGIAASASDATSPVASVKFFVSGSLLGTDTTAPFSLNWNTTTGADGGATIQVVVEDMAGNTTSSPVRNVSVDNVDPTPTLADPGQDLNGTVSLSASSDADTTQVDFERRPAGGGSWVTIASDTTTPWGTSLDTTALADGLYDFRVIVTDATGHTGTSPIRANVRVDNTTPAGSLTTPANGATVGGTSIALGGSYSDAGSGIASVRYELRPTGGGSWTTIATATGAPFSASWDATTVSSGSYDLQPVITDRAGNTSTGAMHTITVDVSAPTVALTNPGATISGSVTLNATVTGSGATQVAFAATPAGGASWSSLGTDTSTPWNATFDTTQLPDGVYDLRATVSDNLGNTSADVVAAIRIDNTAPRVVSSTPGEGATVPSASAIGLVTSEPATPVGVTLDGSATVAPIVNGTNIDYGTGTLGPGPHTLAGELQDSSGKKAPFRVHFTVWSASSSVAPAADKNTTAGGATTVESADGLASATMPAGTWSSSSGDWIVLRITPMAAPTGLTNGFGAGPVTVDVTARWALASTEVHEFSRAISILMRSTEKGLVPATFQNGHWRVLARVPAAGTLPTGWEDGFYSDGAGFHVLTKHLSVFGLLRDLEAPNPPQNVRGFVGPTGLTLRWTPGSDNSGTYDFVTVFSDSTDTGHYGVDYTAASIDGWSAGNPRIFRLKETDLAGNESSLTQPLVPVPSLIGKTPDQAAALLAPLGLKIGTTTTGGTGPAGTITGPAGLVLVEAGSSVDVTVSPGSGSTRLVLKVTTAPRVKPAMLKKSIAARVSVTRAARVTAELFSPRHVKLYTWRFSLKAGRSIVKLRLPSQVRRTGVYTMRWTARSGREAISRQITVRLVGARNVPAAPVQVLLAGPAARSISGQFPTRKPSLVSASGIEPTFDAAASRRTDVRVIVVDVDAFGVSLIRDLHAVFPSTKIIALTSGPKQMLASLRGGASIALPRSTPASILTRVITRLLAKPAKPTRH